MWTGIQKVNKTMVNSPQRGEKEVLEDTPLFVCYDTTFKIKGNQPVRGAAHPAASAAIYCYTFGENWIWKAPGAKSPICPVAARVSGWRTHTYRTQHLRHSRITQRRCKAAEGNSVHTGTELLCCSRQICNSASTMAPHPDLSSFCKAKSSVNRKIPLASSHFSAVTWSFCSF